MYIDFRVTKMMIVEIVLAISDKIRASPSWKGSIRKNQTAIYLRNYSDVILINFQELKEKLSISFLNNIFTLACFFPHVQNLTALHIPEIMFFPNHTNLMLILIRIS